MNKTEIVDYEVNVTTTPDNVPAHFFATDRDGKRYMVNHTSQIKRTVWKNDNMVRVTTSALIKGTNRKSGKTYARWHTDSAYGFYRNPTGNIIGYGVHFAPGGKKIIRREPHIPFNVLEITNTAYAPMHRVFKETCAEVLGITATADIYPIMSHYGMAKYENMHQDLRFSMRASNTREFVERLFGKKNYRRDLVRAVGNCQTPEVLAYASAFRGIVPVDWIVDFINSTEPYADHWAMYGIRSTGEADALRRALGMMDPRSYRLLLRDSFGLQNARLTRDSIRYFKGLLARPDLPPQTADLGGKRIRTWVELHDEIYGIRRRANGELVHQPRLYRADFKPFEDQDITLTPLAQALDNKQAGEYTLVPAKHTSIMTEWGGLMNNCIGGYRQAALSHQGIYGGVYKGETLIANFEIKDGGLSQLLARFNQPLADSTRKTIVAAMNEAGVNSDRPYWGGP